MLLTWSGGVGRGKMEAAGKGAGYTPPA
jgi:hypothetical protein